MNELNKKYIRVIAVYDLDSRMLMYRIINDSFSIIPLNHFIEHLPHDPYYFDSYELTSDVIKLYSDVANQNINFDLQRFAYFFETVGVDDFIYDYPKTQ